MTTPGPQPTAAAAFAARGIQQRSRSIQPRGPSRAALDGRFHYALHSFLAKQEGQVSVIAGDVLEVLDDSNAYWCLIRSIKTEEVGFLPHDNMETANERAARLNSKRNIGASAPLPAERSAPSRPSIPPRLARIQFAPEPRWIEPPTLPEDVDVDKEVDAGVEEPQDGWETGKQSGSMRAKDELREESANEDVESGEELDASEPDASHPAPSPSSTPRVTTTNVTPNAAAPMNQSASDPSAALGPPPRGTPLSHPPRGASMQRLAKPPDPVPEKVTETRHRNPAKLISVGALTRCHWDHWHVLIVLPSRPPRRTLNALDAQRLFFGDKASSSPKHISKVRGPNDTAFRSAGAPVQLPHQSSTDRVSTPVKEVPLPRLPPEDASKAFVAAPAMELEFTTPSSSAPAVPSKDQGTSTLHASDTLTLSPAMTILTIHPKFTCAQEHVSLTVPKATSCWELVTLTLDVLAIPRAAASEYALYVLHMDSGEIRVHPTEVVHTMLEQLRSRALPGVAFRQRVHEGTGPDGTRHHMLVEEGMEDFFKLVLLHFPSQALAGAGEPRLLSICMGEEHDEATGKRYRTVSVPPSATVREAITIALPYFQLPLPPQLPAPQYCLHVSRGGRFYQLEEGEVLDDVLRQVPGPVEFMLQRGEGSGVGPAPSKRQSVKEARKSLASLNLSYLRTEAGGLPGGPLGKRSGGGFFSGPAIALPLPAAAVAWPALQGETASPALSDILDAYGGESSIPPPEVYLLQHAEPEEPMPQLPDRPPSASPPARPSPLTQLLATLDMDFGSLLIEVQEELNTLRNGRSSAMTHLIECGHSLATLDRALGALASKVVRVASHGS